MTMQPDRQQTLDFLSALFAPGECVELRIFRAAFGRGNWIEPAEKYARTLAGWFDNPHALATEAGRLRGVSGFVTLNPVNPALLARSYNKLIKANNTATDEDIACIRWVYVDIDPVRPADISSSADELAAAMERRDAILSENPDLAASSLSGCSGNGMWILVRLPDYPNDKPHRELVGKALTLLGGKYSDGRVKIDQTTKNPARVMCLPGCFKAKGSNIPARPWRMTTIDMIGGKPR